MGHAEAAVAACIEEFEGSVPIPVVEELLTCIGAGPKATVPNPEYARLVAEAGGSGSKGRKGKGGGKDGNKELPPKDVQVDNTSYLVAARIVRKTEDKISTPIANLLNGVLTGDPYVMERTGLCAADAESVEMDARAKSKANKGGKKGKGGKDRGGKEGQSRPRGAPGAAQPEQERVLHLLRAPQDRPRRADDSDRDGGGQPDERRLRQAVSEHQVAGTAVREPGEQHSGQVSAVLQGLAQEARR
ncbi:hypothetical protein THAOC_02497 [Thalassiosira oceanica]|uniref:Uncharacterized protein n=1 Tax=Thalassiosira oceanica TaxID=159749 RepID=K0TFG0_THAOC|nr:hypothetical protein THAOC_02497 [Thalassiosira oceanica]|eukprot:EJK75769.1 hypothetical protein THAOC_02497 [Thalassiosira oceanica]